MKKILIGMLAGVSLTVVAYFLFYPNPTLRINTGRLLDQDTFYLKNGQLIRGWIVKDEGDKIIVDIEKGSLTLNRSSCKEIQENVFLRYLRQLI